VGKSILRANGGAAIAVFGLSCALGALRATPAGAQKKSTEFTRQGLLITNFTPREGSDFGFGRKTGDEVSSRVAKLSNRREVDVISGGDIRYQLTKSSMPEDTVLDEAMIRTLGRYMRADKYVVGTVDRKPKSVRISGRLVLMRDLRMAEPLATTTGTDLGLAAEQFARELTVARNELAAQRRCENALRDAEPQRALQFAREAVAAYPQGVLAHVCLTWALRATGTPATAILAAAREVLAGDSLNPMAWRGGGRAENDGENAKLRALPARRRDTTGGAGRSGSGPRSLARSGKAVPRLPRPARAVRAAADRRVLPEELSDRSLRPRSTLDDPGQGGGDTAGSSLDTCLEGRLASQRALVISPI